MQTPSAAWWLLGSPAEKSHPLTTPAEEMLGTVLVDRRGATILGTGPMADGLDLYYVLVPNARGIMIDPAGHPFCFFLPGA